MTSQSMPSGLRLRREAIGHGRVWDPGLPVVGYMSKAMWVGGGVYEGNSSPLEPESTPHDRDLGSLGRPVKYDF